MADGKGQLPASLLRVRPPNDGSEGDTLCPDNGGDSGPDYWPRLGRSAGGSQAHSPPALVSGFHHPPTLWTPLRRLLFL